MTRGINVSNFVELLSALATDTKARKNYEGDTKGRPVRISSDRLALKAEHTRRETRLQYNDDLILLYVVGVSKNFELWMLEYWNNDKFDRSQKASWNVKEVYLFCHLFFRFF